MICQHCKETRHTLCRGRTWCDCQHRVPVGPTWHEVKSAEELTALLQEMDTESPSWDGDYPGNEQGYPFRA